MGERILLIKQDSLKLTLKIMSQKFCWLMPDAALVKSKLLHVVWLRIKLWTWAVMSLLAVFLIPNSCKYFRVRVDLCCYCQKLWLGLQVVQLLKCPLCLRCGVFSYLFVCFISAKSYPVSFEKLILIFLQYCWAGNTGCSSEMQI